MSEEHEGATPRLDRNDTDGPKCGACGWAHEWGDLGLRHDYGVQEACPRCGFGYKAPPTDESNFRQVVSPEDRPTYRLPDHEVLRRLPAIERIDDDAVREETIDIAARAPAYFWLEPASTSGYHHPVCQETRGLWAHTLMVARAVERLSETAVGLGELPEIDVDLARSAAVLHDMRKNGPHESPEPSSTSDHDVEMARVIHGSDLPMDVADAVASHMGPWYDGPEPETPLERLVHNADMVASTSDITVHVADAPVELVEIGVTGGHDDE